MVEMIKTFQKPIKEKAGAKSIKTLFARPISRCMKQKRVNRAFTFPGLVSGTGELYPITVCLGTFFTYTYIPILSYTGEDTALVL